MEYSKALDMEPWTSPIDNRPYHKVCTFRLTQKNPRHYGASMQYGFSIGEADAKEIEGDTQAGQNSAGEPNHVYDVGHIAGREMWQRSFGEVVSPELDGACSQRSPAPGGIASTTRRKPPRRKTTSSGRA